jgi:hypothetical protein
MCKFSVFLIAGKFQNCQIIDRSEWSQSPRVFTSESSPDYKVKENEKRSSNNFSFLGKKEAKQARELKLHDGYQSTVFKRQKLVLGSGHVATVLYFDRHTHHNIKLPQDKG